MGPSDQVSLLLVDAKHLMWRAASTFTDLHVEQKDGTVKQTGAIYGWLRIALATQLRFGGIVVACWDRTEGPIERRKLYPFYKNKPPSSKPKPAKKRAPTRYSSDGVTGEYDARDRASSATVERDVMLASMREQEVDLRRILTLLGIRQVSSLGWEADDVIATLCSHYAKADIGILSGDRDLLQLATRETKLIRPQPKGAFAVFDANKVLEEYKLQPHQILDLKALAGDASDNIPGAKGIGPVSATKLIQEHHTWQQCLQWANNSTQTSNLARKLVASSEMVSLSAQLVKLNRMAPLEFIDGQRDGKQAMLTMASLKLNSLLSDGRREQLMAMGG